MPSVETIYQESIRPLPLADQMRLADMILKHSPNTIKRSQRRSVLDIIKEAREHIPKRSAAEIDEYLKTERDSWHD
jgi:hypothetical protein